MTRISQIQTEVSDFYGIDRAEMVGPSRCRMFVLPRSVAMAMSRELIADASYIAIGSQFGGRDHSTAIHAIKRVNEWRKDTDFDAGYRDLRDRVAARISPMFRRHGTPMFRTIRKEASQ